LKPIKVPNPDITYEITVTKFYGDIELDCFFQFAHLYNFMVGPRAPIEIAIMKISDIIWSDSTIKFPQPKLQGKIRKIRLPDAFVKG
jgi:hypothetical protein